jgi:nucleoside-diphosphate-sugar epimerase
MRIYVTGATGFLGRRIVDRALERGHQVVALSRDPSRLAPRPGLEPRRLDLLELDAVLPAIEDCEAGIHAAGAGPSAGERELHDANVQASRHLAGSARRQTKLARLVAITSAAVLEPGDTPYRRAKIGQEAAIRSYGLDLTLLRPTLVLGPHAETQDLTRLVARLRSTEAFPLVGGGTTRIQPVDVEDVATAAVTAVERPATIGGIYTLAGPEGGIAWRDFVAEAKRRVGGKAKLRTAPRAPLRVLAALLSLLGRGESLRAALAYYGGDHLHSLAEVRRALDFDPRPYEESLTRAFGP